MGDGDGDFVNVGISLGNTIGLGNGDGHFVYIAGGSYGAQGNTIIVGNGDGDAVNSQGGSHNAITVGNGDGDIVNNRGGSNNTITLGSGNGDVVNDLGSYDTITLGNGSDTVTAISSLINGGHGHDTFVFTGSFGQDTITNFSPGTITLCWLRPCLQTSAPYRTT